MNFLSAIRAMKEGKKVKRKSFHPNAYICRRGLNEAIINSKDELAVFNLADLEATDWQIVGEKKMGIQHSMSKEQKEFYDRGFKDGRNWDKLTLKEKKTLSSKVISGGSMYPSNYYEKDVKEKLEEFINWLSGIDTRVKITEKAREIFGSRLVDIEKD